jgi:hypothetical protein
MRKRRTRAETDADKPGCALNPQVKFSRQRWIDSGDLGASIYEKVVWPGMVDYDGHNYLRALDEPEA